MSIVCDFGALYQRYASDITRSFHFGPRDEEMKQVHDTVFAAQEAALAVVRDGAIAKDVHRAAAKVIDDSPFKRTVHPRSRPFDRARRPRRVRHEPRSARSRS